MMLIQAHGGHRTGAALFTLEGVLLKWDLGILGSNFASPGPTDLSPQCVQSPDLLGHLLGPS